MPPGTSGQEVVCKQVDQERGPSQSSERLQHLPSASTHVAPSRLCAVWLVFSPWHQDKGSKRQELPHRVHITSI